MPWRCPACHTTIQHDELEQQLRPNVVYRCYVCRLEFQLNAGTKQLELAPVPVRPERERALSES